MNHWCEDWLEMSDEAAADEPGTLTDSESDVKLPDVSSRYGPIPTQSRTWKSSPSDRSAKFHPSSVCVAVPV